MSQSLVEFCSVTSLCEGWAKKQHTAFMVSG